jgi:hypothetical protein
MRIRTIATLSTTALLAAVPAAAADPPSRNGSNCAGVFASDVIAGTPGIPSMVAQGGPGAVAGAVLADANCGDNRPG